VKNSDSLIQKQFNIPKELQIREAKNRLFSKFTRRYIQEL